MAIMTFILVPKKHYRGSIQLHQGSSKAQGLHNEITRRGTSTSLEFSDEVIGIGQFNKTSSGRVTVELLVMANRNLEWKTMDMECLKDRKDLVRDIFEFTLWPQWLCYAAGQASGFKIDRWVNVGSSIHGSEWGCWYSRLSLLNEKFCRGSIYTHKSSPLIKLPSAFVPSDLRLL